MDTTRKKQPDYQFIFIGGAPRSDTTLIQRILNSHSHIIGGPEFDDLPKLTEVFYEIRDISDKRKGVYFNETELDEIYKKLLFILLAKKPLHKKNKNVLSEKTPSNIMVFDKLLQFLPNEIYFHFTRSPSDC